MEIFQEGDQMDRLEQLRQAIDEIMRKNPDLEESRCGFVLFVICY